jgi:hypothetical protein
MADVKKQNLFKSVISNYDPRVIKDRFNRIRMSPYKAIKFQYQASFVIVIVVCLVIAYELISLILHYPGTGMMALLGQGAILVVMVMIVIKAFGTLAPLKKTLEHYEKTPSTIGKTQTINVADTVDEILAKYDKDKKVVEAKVDNKVDDKKSEVKKVGSKKK